MFPLDTLRGLVADGTVGELAPRTSYTCMGGIYSSRRVREQLAPAIVERCLERPQVDGLLLVPV